jgi:lipopolysaccharide export LptBFGC system permease protein LptF
VIVRRWITVTLSRMVERMAAFSPPRHRELVRGMMRELDAIADPAERMRFALGAIATIARLTLRAYAPTAVHGLARFVGMGEAEDGSSLGGPSMSTLTTRQLLRRHVAPFTVSVACLTLLMLAPHAMRQVPELSGSGRSVGAIAQVLLLAVPHTMALTIPMAVFLAVSWVFTRLGAEGVLAAARRGRHGVRRLVIPVLGAAAVMATLTLASNTQVVPRANARLTAVLEGAPQRLTDRSMTIGQLREAAQRARTAYGPGAAARAASLEVEIQKKFALAAACLFLALVGAAAAIRFPRGGARLFLGASGFVFTGYYLSLVAGESLADRLVISPVVAMWMANAFLLAVVLLLLGRPGGASVAAGTETLGVGRAPRSDQDRSSGGTARVGMATSYPQENGEWCPHRI